MRQPRHRARVVLALSVVILGRGLEAQAQSDRPGRADAESVRCFESRPPPPPPRPPSPVGVYVGGSVALPGPVRGAPPRTRTGNPPSTPPSSERGDVAGTSESDGKLDVGGGDVEAILVLVVVGLAILPVLLHVVDAAPPEPVAERYKCPEVSLRLVGGYTDAPTSLDPKVANPGTGVGFGGLHASMSWGPIGFAGELEFGPTELYQQQAAFAFVRPEPKAHVDWRLALGYRRTVFGPVESHAFEVALPHRYYFNPEQRNLGLELRPALRFGNLGFDARLDGAVLIPLGDVLHLDLGGRVFALGPRLQTAVFGNLSFDL